MHLSILALAIVGTLTAHAQPREHILYLVGDAGKAGPGGSQPVLDLVRQVSAEDSAKARTLLFLGDNIYESGLHAADHPLWVKDTANIGPQLRAMEEFNGACRILPGNHDWARGAADGLQAVRREEAYAEAALGPDVFVPDGGCPGPVLIPLGSDAVLIMVDTQWWIQDEGRPEGPEGQCAQRTEEEVLSALEGLLTANRGKRVIVAGHHPCISYGSHGGRFPLREHLFPLTAVWKEAWIPLPVIGSLYPLYRSWVGADQDLRGKRYGHLVDRLSTLLARFPGVSYVAGHEHVLQYVQRAGVHHVVSGAGAKSSWVKRKRGPVFAHQGRGFARIVMSGTAAELQFFTVADGMRPVFSASLPIAR